MAVLFLAFGLGVLAGIVFGGGMVEWYFAKQMKAWAGGKMIRHQGAYWQMRKVLHVVRQQDPS